MMTMIAVWRNRVDLPPMLGPVSTITHPFELPRSVSLGMKSMLEAFFVASLKVLISSKYFYVFLFNSYFVNLTVFLHSYVLLLMFLNI